VSGLADDVLSKGERELSEARASRGIADEKAAVEDDISTSESALGRVRESTASLPTPSARDRRLARERRALEQLQALKSARAAGPPEQPAEPSHDPLDDRPRPRTLSTGERERRDGEERAQRELDSLKEQQGHPEDRPPVKRTL